LEVLQVPILLRAVRWADFWVMRLVARAVARSLPGL
jgi:hypothetical protein